MAVKTVEQIKEELQRVRELRFYEEMAEFMNWSAYNMYTERIKKLEEDLKEAENDRARGKGNS